MIYEPIFLNEKSSVPMYRQLYDSIRGKICGGELTVGEKMPSIRRIADELGVSRTTVEQAYQQLCVEGYLTSRPQSGYYVEAAPQGGFLPPRPESPEKSPEAELPYDFGSRYVDPRGYDLNLWRKYVRSVLSREDIVSSYGHHQGEPELREQLSRYGTLLRGVDSSPDRIVIGAGVQPLLSLICGLLGDRAGRVGIEYPCFPHAERVFRDFRMDIAELRHDKYGVMPGELYDSGIDVLYLNPSNTESMGRPMPVSRRAVLLEWAEKTDGLIIEDDYNGALRFRSRPVPAMQGMDGGGRVIYLGSFSKLLMPSVRISYMVLPPDLAELYRVRGSSYNQTSSKIEQLALAEFIRDGHIEKTIRRLRKIYAEKSELLLSLLNEYFGETAGIRLAETALCTELSVNCDKSASELALVAIAGGVRVIPTKSADGTAKLRLSFAGIPAEKMRKGVELLRELISPYCRSRT
jgi:Transcriptional regulators containing a DNA-binding HTH domain and an aminotransferase domain (MocR family) and their eukaryotic orthologs